MGALQASNGVGARVRGAEGEGVLEVWGFPYSLGGEKGIRELGLGWVLEV